MKVNEPLGLMFWLDWGIGPKEKYWKRHLSYRILLKAKTYEEDITNPTQILQSSVTRKAVLHFSPKIQEIVLQPISFSYILLIFDLRNSCTQQGKCISKYLFTILSSEEIAESTTWEETGSTFYLYIYIYTFILCLMSLFFFRNLIEKVKGKSNNTKK